MAKRKKKGTVPEIYEQYWRRDNKMVWHFIPLDSKSEYRMYVQDNKGYIQRRTDKTFLVNGLEVINDDELCTKLRQEMRGKLWELGINWEIILI